MPAISSIYLFVIVWNIDFIWTTYLQYLLYCFNHLPSQEVSHNGSFREQTSAMWSIFIFFVNFMNTTEYLHNDFVCVILLSKAFLGFGKALCRICCKMQVVSSIFTWFEKICAKLILQCSAAHYLSRKTRKISHNL